jgi:hypothetical protein
MHRCHGAVAAANKTTPQEPAASQCACRAVICVAAAATAQLTTCGFYRKIRMLKQIVDAGHSRSDSFILGAGMQPHASSIANTVKCITRKAAEVTMKWSLDSKRGPKDGRKRE